jgi:hypothetical protein
MELVAWLAGLLVVYLIDWPVSLQSVSQLVQITVTDLLSISRISH